MSTISNVGTWTRDTTVSTSADVMTAYQVREFVRHMDLAGVPDEAEVTANRSYETTRFNGLRVRVPETLHAAASEPDRA